MKLLSPANDYPESYWFLYDHANSIDHLNFYECKKVKTPPHLPQATLKYKVSIKTIRTYDYLFSDGPDIIGARLAKVIKECDLKYNLQLIPLEVTINGERYDDYFVINYLKCEAAFDLESSEWKPLIKSMPDGPKKFSKIVLFDKEPENLIFRATESNSHIVASDEAVNIFEANSVRGIEFLPGKS